MGSFEKTTWETIGYMVTIGVFLLTLLLFKRKVSDSEKILIVALIFFYFAVFFNLIGLIKVSDYMSVLGFIVIGMSLIRIFLSDTN